MFNAKYLEHAELAWETLRVGLLLLGCRSLLQGARSAAEGEANAAPARRMSWKKAQQHVLTPGP